MPTTYTPNYNLAKPDGTVAGDFVDVSVLNDNADLIDTAVAAIQVDLTAAEADIVAIQAAGAVPPKFARKTVDEDVIASTVLQDDNELFVNLDELGTWEIDLNLLVNEGAGNSDIKFGFTYPAATFIHAHAGDGKANPTPSPASGATFITASLSATVIGLNYKVYIRNTATGLFKLQWAQNVSQATATSVKIGSGMVARFIEA